MEKRAINQGWVNRKWEKHSDIKRIIRLAKMKELPETELYKNCRWHLMSRSCRRNLVLPIHPIR